MKKNILNVVLLILATSCNKNNDAEPTTPEGNNKKWTAIAAIPGPGRKYASCFVIGSKFYVGLGNGIKNSAQQDLDDFYEYDITTGTWLQKANFPGGARENCLSFSINGKGYIALGRQINCTPGCMGMNCCSETNFTDFWEYNSATDVWKKIADFRSQNLTYLYNYSPMILNNKAYFLTQSNTWEFDPVTLSLNSKTPCPLNILGSASFSINNIGYVGTGDDLIPESVQSFYEYNPLDDKWTRKADFPGKGRRFATGFAINQVGYIACGEGVNQTGQSLYDYVGLKDVWEYNPTSNTWKQSLDFPGYKSFYNVSGVSGNNAIIGTGITYDIGLPQAFLKEFYIYK